MAASSAISVTILKASIPFFSSSRLCFSRHLCHQSTAQISCTQKHLHQVDRTRFPLTLSQLLSNSFSSLSNHRDKSPPEIRPPSPVEPDMIPREVPGIKTPAPEVDDPIPPDVVDPPLPREPPGPNHPGPELPVPPMPSPPTPEVPLPSGPDVMPPQPPDVLPPRQPEISPPPPTPSDFPPLTGIDTLFRVPF